MVHKALNNLEGITCNEADGALYAFPRIRLSKKAKNTAEGKGVPADEYYCLQVTVGVFFLHLFSLSSCSESWPVQKHGKARNLNT